MKIFVGMSGGVDSSLTAALLKEQGHDVTGVYMKNWSQDIGGFQCPWKDDLRDAKRVAVQLGIPLQIFDFENQYKQKVVDHMIDSYKQGLTPNPDVMCNQEIKFKVFLEAALEQGADMIATGHYASTKDGKLLMAADHGKDQTYFLYRVSSSALEKTLFPLGEMTKTEVREQADKRGLFTANKKESMGICFVGKVGIKDFLKQYVTTSPGDILNQHGEVLGQHDGAIFYTIGQRHGLDIGGGLPYYVIAKDIEANTVTVTNNLDDQALWSEQIKIISPNWINQSPEVGDTYKVRSRHRAKLLDATLDSIDQDSALFKLSTPLRALTPGQSLVVYRDQQCLGGGIVTK